MPSKPVRFDYFRLITQRYNKDKNYFYDQPFDIGPIINKASMLPVQSRTCSIADEEAKLQIAESLQTFGEGQVIWGMQFVRVKKHQTPGIVGDDGSFDYMKLDDGYYIGEESTVLFDSELCVAVVQRNRDSLSPAGIQLFFNKAYPDEEIKFKPIVPQNILDKIKGRDYRSIKIGLANLRNSNLPKNSVLGLVKGLAPYNSINAYIDLTMGLKRKEIGLEEQEVMATIKELYGLAEVTKLEISIVDDDLRTRPYDLIENRIHDKLLLKYSREEPITYSRVVDQVLSAYYNKRPEIQRSL